MEKYTIYANGIKLDTFDDDNISLNYQIDDILDITKRSTNYTKTVKLPGSITNNLFFKNIFDVNIDNIDFNPSVSIPSSLTVDDNLILQGNLQLLNIIKDKEAINYEIIITGVFKNIMDVFSDYNLSDLDFSEYNHNRNKTTIIDSWTHKNYVNNTLTDLSGLGYGYVYPYIINGNNQDIGINTYVTDLYPAIYLKNIVDKMFEFSGYTYTSDFFNSEYFKKLILPFTDGILELPKEEIEKKQIIVGIDDGVDYESLSPVRSNGSDWYYNSSNNYLLALNRESGTVTDDNTDLTFMDLSGQWDGNMFTCDKTGRYNVNFKGNIVPLITHDDGPGTPLEYKEGNFEYLYRLELVRSNGTVLELDSSKDKTDPNDLYGVRLFGLSPTVHYSPWYDVNISPSLNFSLNSNNLLMESGDKLRIVFGFRYPDSVKFYTTANKIKVKLLLKKDYAGSFTKMSVVSANSESVVNEDINMNQVLSKQIKMKSLFIDLIKMFNLIIQDNPNKENDLIIEPRDDYFNSRKLVIDWSKKIDKDNDIKIIPMSDLDAKTYEYSYQLDSDLYNEEYNNEFKKTYGDLKIDVINDFSINTNKTEINFASTINADYLINDRKAPFFVTQGDDKLMVKKVKPRILFYGGLIDCENFNIRDSFGATNIITLSQYPYCGMWDHPTEPQYDLSFGRPEKYYHHTNVMPSLNLFENFHKSTLKNVIDINSRLMEASFYLTPKDIAEFDFRNIIWCEDTYWRVNKIKDYNPIGQSNVTTVILYKIIDLDVINKYNVILPKSNGSCPTDISIVFSKKQPGKDTRAYYYSKSGTVITENCCNSKGGYYENGVCYLEPGNTGVNDGSTGKPKGNKPKTINSNNTFVPATKPNGGNATNNSGNTINQGGIKVLGSNNYVPPNTDTTAIIVGDNNSIPKNVTNVMVVGDNIIATESDTIYIGDIKIDKDGNITNSKSYIIDGGLDIVFPFDKTNFIDVVDGTFDSVKNPGGDSKNRPIIDGGSDNI